MDSDFDIPFRKQVQADLVDYPHLVKDDVVKRLSISIGPRPVVQIGVESLVIHPEPFDADGALSTACRAFLISSVEKVVRHFNSPICIVWSASSSTYVEADSITDSGEANPQTEFERKIAPKNASVRSAALRKAVEKHQQQQSRTQRLATYPHLFVRIASAVYQCEGILIEHTPGVPIAQIGHQCSLVFHPEPFNADGTISAACQQFLINTVQHAVRRNGHRICIVWSPVSCTYVEADSTTLSTEPPSGGLKLPSDIQFDKRHDPLGFKQGK